MNCVVPQIPEEAEEEEEEEDVDAGELEEEDAEEEYPYTAGHTAPLASFLN